MPGPAQRDGSGGRIDDQETAGREQEPVRIGVQVAQPAVGPGHDLGRAVAFPGVRVHGGPQPSHKGGGDQVVPLDVSDYQGGLATGAAHHVVEVAADLDARGGGLVPGRDRHPGRGQRLPRQHDPLQFGRQRVLGLVHPRPLH